MTVTIHGRPCWYELATDAAALKSEEEFYAHILGWDLQDSGLAGFDYHLAKRGPHMVAGFMPAPGGAGGSTPSWLIYFGVDDADRTLAAARSAGATVESEPQTVPGTGRVAVVVDPQGASFGVLEPDMSDMSEAEMAAIREGRGAFDQARPGHAQWHELMAADPEAALAFYSSLFGWTRGEVVDMGPMGGYHLFRHDGADIGGAMGLGDSGAPAWLPYFGADGSLTAAAEAIGGRGGSVHHGPHEVPGGGYILVARDPEGAWFALTGRDE